MKKNILILCSVCLIALFLAWNFFFKQLFLKAPRIVKKEQAKARVAIVLDDWGYSINCLKLLRQFKIPLTISILPNLKYSTKIAEEAKKLGKEVVLHLPLQPEIGTRDNIKLEKNTITTEMSLEKIVEQLNSALASVPFAKGVSNHMGSLATRDEKLMAIIFTEIKKRKLYFLDNLVTPQSICKSLAQKMKIGFAQRDFFLDNSDNEEYIKRQFARFGEYALGSSKAIAVGHARPTTLKVLSKEIDTLKAKGIEFVFVSELVE